MYTLSISNLITVASQMTPIKEFFLFPSIPLVLLSLVSLFIINSITKRSRNSFKNHKNLPPSPPKLPFIGNLHQIGSLLHQSLHSLSLKHGPLMLIHLGEAPFLIVSSSEMACGIMRTHDLAFASRPPSVVTDIISFIDIGFQPYGETWRQLRKIFTLHLLSSKMVESHKGIREEEVGRMIQDIRNRASLQNSNPIDVSDVLSIFMCNLLSRIVCGEFIRKEGKLGVLRELVRERNDLISQSSVWDLFPSISWLDLGFSGLRRRAKKCRDRWDVLLSEMIRAYEEKGESGKGEGDFIDELLSLKNDPGMTFDFNNEHIKGLVGDTFAAGVDTTYITLEWAMSELVRNPNLMKKLQDEVRGIAKDKDNIEPEDLIKMNYLKAVIKETLRLHPPAPLLLTRQSMEQCYINGFNIPKGVRVLVNVWAIGREPKSWEEPEEFNPERFIESQVDYKGKDFQFIPFGAGRRMCPGIQFSMATAQLALANLVHQFDWEFPSGVTADEFDMSGSAGITVPRKDSLQLVVKDVQF
ncbi:hypothetical protein LUZ60_013966 [Juncus effusus]|nr:hypothetical protein LUZ60_013966 [Juncus effusus]